MGGETLSDLRKPPDIEWREFTIATLEAALTARRPILFDLTYVQDIADVLSGSGRYAAAITTRELRYLRLHWARFQAIVQFYENDEMRQPPW